MATEFIDIFDTAVKIGLGALISGVVTYLVTKESNKHETYKELQKRRLDTIEHALDGLNAFLNPFARLLALISGQKKLHPDFTDLADKKYEAVRKNIRKLDTIYVDARNERNVAISRLSLLKLDKVIEHLDALDDLEREIRDQVMFNHKIPSYETIRDWVAQLKECKKNIFKELSKEYTKQPF